MEYFMYGLFNPLAPELSGHAVAKLVEAPRRKPEGHGFDLWCQNDAVRCRNF